MSLGEPWPYPYNWGFPMNDPFRLVNDWNERMKRAGFPVSETQAEDDRKNLEAILIMARECDKLKAENARLEAENAELKARLGDKT